MKKYLVILILVLINAHINAQHISTQTTDPGTMDIYHLSGKLGIGTSNPQTPVHIRQNAMLGSNLGDFEPLLRLEGETNNNVYENTWIYRDASGSDWHTSRIHNGISVDGSFLTPGVDTKTWWERDPNNNIQSWGSGSNPYMTLKGSQLGIGTDNPGNKLDVNGGIRSNTEIVVSNPNNSGASVKLDWQNDIPRIRILGSGAGANNGLDIQGTGDNSFLRIKGNGVGIGTNSPSEKLEVNGNIKLTNNAPILHFYETDNNKSWYLLGDGSKFFIRNGSLSSSALVIDDSGKIGIGTSAPAHKLDVKGTIHAEEVIVDLNVEGPDYVFEPDYDLKNLSDLDQFLKTNKHLPEVPSAAQMKAEGVNLVEMQMLLLKKVEELTLHLIEQQKEIENLKNIINNKN